MEIEMGKKYTSNGRPIRILCVDRPIPVFPVVGMDEENGAIHYFMKDGTISEVSVNLKRNETLEDYNLVEVFETEEDKWNWFLFSNEYDSAVLCGFYR